MKKKLMGVCGATATVVAMLSFAPAPANAAGCAQLTSAYRDGASNYAKVKNVCGSSISARPTVNNFPDPNCRTIGAGKTVTFRTGGSLSPKASGAAVC